MIYEREMNRELIAVIVVFGTLGLLVGISNSLNVPRKPETSPLPPEPVAGDIAIEIIPEQAENDSVPFLATVVIRNVAGHPLLLSSQKFEARIELVSGSSELTSEAHSSQSRGQYSWSAHGIRWYGIEVHFDPAYGNQTQEFRLTAQFGTASSTFPGVSASTIIRTPLELAGMKLSDDTD
jgi:hypothetical protein